MKRILVIVVLFFCFGCKSDKKIDYDKLKYKVRKELMLEGYMKNPELTLESEKEGKLYQFYEDEIQINNEKRTKISSVLDSFKTNKEYLLNTFRKKRDSTNNNFSPLDEYDMIVMAEEISLDEVNQKIDSLSQLYKNIPQDAIYYEFNYDIKWTYVGDNKRFSNTVKVYTDKYLNILKWFNENDLKEIQKK